MSSGQGVSVGLAGATDARSESGSEPFRINIAGHSLSIQPHYSAGQTISAVEAQELNRVWLEQLKASLRKQVKAKPELVRAELQALANQFKLSSERPLRLSPDPTERMALEIARGAARTLLARAGESTEGMPKAEFEQMVRRLAQEEVILGEARRRVLATQKLLAEGLGEIEL